MCVDFKHWALRLYLFLTHSWTLAVGGGERKRGEGICLERGRIMGQGNEWERSVSPTSLRLICFSHQRSPAVDLSSPLHSPHSFCPPPILPHPLLLTLTVATVCHCVTCAFGVCVACVFVCAGVLVRLIFNHFSQCLFRWATVVLTPSSSQTPVNECECVRVLVRAYPSASLRETDLALNSLTRKTHVLTSTLSVKYTETINKGKMYMIKWNE